jgi:hypothetical protein
MRRASPAFLALFALGLLIRVVGLPSWGTFDVEVQKAWSARAADAGLADIYGPSDAAILELAARRGQPVWSVEVPRTEFHWGSASYFVDYPPGSLVVLWVVGKLYEWFDAEMPNRHGFNAAINLAPLLAGAAIAWLLLASASGATGERRALAFWANPALILAAPFLGYQDTLFGALALAAVLLLMSRRYVAATALVVVAGLVKPQGALLLPTLALLVWREAPRLVPRAALAALGAAVLVLLPWWSQGHLLSALDGCRRPLAQGTLAPLGLNLWWAAGWMLDAWRGHRLPLARILTLDEFRVATGIDAVFVARLLLGAATLCNLWLLAKGLPRGRWFIPLSVVLQVHAYALLGTSVHENHTLLALIVAPLLIGEWHRAKSVVASTSAFALLSLLFAAGLGRRLTRQADLGALKLLTRIDASVLVALGHVVLVGLLFGWTLQAARATPVREARENPT